MNVQCTRSRVVHFTHRWMAANLTRNTSTTALRQTGAVTANQEFLQSRNDGDVVVKDGRIGVRSEEHETDPFLKNEIKKYNTGIDKY